MRDDKGSGRNYGGFSSATKTDFYSVSILFGPPGARKSSTAFLSCPEPIRTINFDGRDIPAMDRAKDTCSVCGKMFDKHKGEDHKFKPIDIERSELQTTEDFDKMDPEVAKKLAREMMSAFWRDYELALKICAPNPRTKKRGTIVIDTFEEFKPILCASILGTAAIPYKQLRAQGRLNQICRDIVARARRAKVNLVILAREAEIYSNDKGTGYYKPKAPGALLESVDWAGFIEVKSEIRGKKANITPRITMMKCGGNDGELFKIYTPDDWGDDGAFAWICYNQWLKSEIEDWR